jgi:broad specificity phosphatase PhoE
MLELQEMLLVRHGESTANAKGIWQGQMEFPLSERGREQATLAGHGLSSEPFEGLYSSPLSRAMQTAEIIRDRSGFTGQVVPVDGLSERNGGILEGHTWAEQEHRNPELAKKFLAIPEEERWALVGAETDEEVIARFEEALSLIRSLHSGGSRIVVVSHGGVVRAFLRKRFGPQVLPGARRVANASITRLQWDATGPRLLEVGSTVHLTEDPGASTVE